MGISWSQSSNDDSRKQAFLHNGKVDKEAGPPAAGITEAPTGFDNLTNGYLDQGRAYELINKNNVKPGRSFNDDRFAFEEVEEIEDGIGPTYNAQSCRECHQNVVTGGASQVTEHRTGRMDNGVFFESLGGSLVQSRATHPDILERVSVQDDIRTFRISTNTLGDGYVECIANETFTAIQNQQPAAMRGSTALVPVLEGNGGARIGRFGWKSQHASLLSFSADAYVNELGITSPLLPTENTSSGRFVGFGSGFDTVQDPENDGDDVIAFADFMRSTKAPPRGRIDATVQAGESLFTQIGCGTCHVASITTAPAGTQINAGRFVVPPALGDKIIHPYSDFMLHDIGTGDGIPILPTPEYASTANQIRTAPLWALRTRNRLMHDGLSFTRQEAIRRHAGQAAPVTAAFSALSIEQQTSVIAFLDSL